MSWIKLTEEEQHHTMGRLIGLIGKYVPGAKNEWSEHASCLTMPDTYCGTLVIHIDNDGYTMYKIADGDF